MYYWLILIIKLIDKIWKCCGSIYLGWNKCGVGMWTPELRVIILWTASTWKMFTVLHKWSWVIKSTFRIDRWWLLVSVERYTHVSCGFLTLFSYPKSVLEMLWCLYAAEFEIHSMWIVCLWRPKFSDLAKSEASKAVLKHACKSGLILNSVLMKHS